MYVTWGTRFAVTSQGEPGLAGATVGAYSVCARLLTARRTKEAFVHIWKGETKNRTHIDYNTQRFVVLQLFKFHKKYSAAK